MKHSRLVTRRIVGLSALLLANTLTACSDATGPEHVASRSGYLTISAAVLRNLPVNFDTQYPGLTWQAPTQRTSGDTVIQSFMVNVETGSLINFGGSSGHIVAIPANSICDPATTSYGPTEWLKPCEIAEDSINFEVRSWTDSLGVPHAKFSPDVRFSPNSTQSAALYLQDAALKSYSTVFIPYCNVTNVCVKEEDTDAALTTYASPLSGGGYWVFRKLRHFSGYNVTAF